MPFFTKKPVTIEARRLDSVSAANIEKWCHGRILRTGNLEIDTLEGTMEACPGDWVIKGVKGEFYPCKPDVFEASYESVSGPSGVSTC